MKFRKILVILLVFCLASSLAACGKKAETPPAEVPAPAAEVPAPAEATPDAGSTAELSVFMVWNTRPFNDEWPVFLEATKATGVTLKSYTSSSETDETQAFNLMLSTGELPDIVAGKTSEIEKLGVDGGLMDMKALIESNAPNLKAFMAANPDLAKDMYSADGDIFLLPSFVDYKNLSVTEGLFIRQDWLDKLSLKTPTTIDELEEVFTAFIEKDANGNGKKDEIPYFRRADVRTACTNILQLFGSRAYFPESGQALSGMYILDDKLVYEPTTERFKYAIEKASDWYGKGLIDQEIFTRGMGARDALFPTDLGGATIDWFPSTAAYNKLADDDQVAGFSLQPIAPVTTGSGTRTYMYTRATNSGRGWGISSNCKDPEAAMRLMDWFYSEEGIRTFNYGVEGDTYTMVDGKPEFTDKVLNNPEGASPLEILNNIGSQIQDFGTMQLAAYEYSIANDIARKGYDIYMEDGNTQSSLPVLKYTNDELKKLETINGKLVPYMEENIQKWIMGASKFDSDYDEFLQTIEEMGAGEAVAINQAAYDRYNAN